MHWLFASPRSRMMPAVVIDRSGAGSGMPRHSFFPQTTHVNRSSRLSSQAACCRRASTEAHSFLDEVSARVNGVGELAQRRLLHPDLTEVGFNGHALALPGRRAVAIEGENPAGHQQRIELLQPDERRLVEIHIEVQEAETGALTVAGERRHG